MSAQIYGGSVSPSTALTINEQTGTTYTFVLSDSNNTVVIGNNGSAQTFTIPLNLTTAFPIGATINVIQKGGGQITVVGAAGVSIGSNAGTAAQPKTRNQYAGLSCIKVATDTWYVLGDLT